MLCLQENREKVALLLQLSDNLIEKGHTHTDNIKSWASLVDRRYNDFSVNMEKYRDKLMSTLGIPLDGSGVSNVMCGESLGTAHLIGIYQLEAFVLNVM